LQPHMVREPSKSNKDFAASTRYVDAVGSITNGTVGAMLSLLALMHV
jgi:hypothetical protein